MNDTPQTSVSDPADNLIRHNNRKASEQGKEMLAGRLERVTA